MEYQIAICSSDAVFARMLELEFSMLGKRVFCSDRIPSELSGDVVLLDLDTCTAPESGQYRRLIGFTSNSSLLSDDVRRQCSMILHRPFEMRLLRREIFSEQEETVSLAYPSRQSKRENHAQKEIRLQDDQLVVEGQSFRLGPNEARLVQILLEHRGEVVSKELLSEVIGESSANKVEVYICYLRRKLDESLGFKLIYTVRQKGYCIR